eukprot:1175997-Prorocentrum_minimum.AAC.2
MGFRPCPSFGGRVVCRVLGRDEARAGRCCRMREERECWSGGVLTRTVARVPPLGVWCLLPRVSPCSV